MDTFPFAKSFLISLTFTTAFVPQLGVSGDEPATAGMINLTTSSSTYREDTKTVDLVVTRTGGADGIASVEFTTSQNTATENSDYASTSGTLSWADGDSESKVISVPINDDLSIEPTEDFLVAISNASGASLGTTTSTTIDIVDNDHYHAFIDSWSIYKNLVIMDPADTTNPITLVSGTDYNNQVDAATYVRNFSYDSAGKIISSGQYESVVYAFGGKLYRIKLGYSPTPLVNRITQVSSETDALNPCYISSIVDYADAENTVLIYALPGANDFCDWGGDDVYKAIKLGDDALATPTNAFFDVVVTLRDWDSGGSITGFLVRSGTELVKYDASFDNPSIVLSNVSYVNAMVDNGGGFHYLILDTAGGKYIGIYDKADDSVTNVYTITTGIDTNSARMDADNLYFSDGDSFNGPNVIKRLELGTKTPTVVTMMSSSEPNGVWSMELVGDYVVYTVMENWNVTAAKSLTKTAVEAIPSTIVSTTGSERLLPQFYGSNKFYYDRMIENESYNVTLMKAGVINPDGSEQSETTDARWFGDTRANTYSQPDSQMYAPATGTMLATGCTVDGTKSYFDACANGSLTLKHFDNSVDTSLGTIPAGISWFDFVTDQIKFTPTPASVDYNLYMIDVSNGLVSLANSGSHYWSYSFEVWENRGP